MKKRIPARMVTVCDVCGHEDASLTRCIICGKEYCWMCRGMIFGSMVMPDICDKCDVREDVRKVVAQYTAKIASIVAKRDAALMQLGKKTAKDEIEVKQPAEKREGDPR